MLTCVRSKNPTVAVTTNGRTFTWDTNADVIVDTNTNYVYLNKAGCVTRNSEEAESVLITHENDLIQIPYMDFLSNRIESLYNQIQQENFKTKNLINYVQSGLLPRPWNYEYDWWEE